VSRDAIHFQKQEPNPLALPPQGYSPYHYRDPVVFRDEQTGLFHMLVTASLEDYPVPDRGGCLAHLVSKDLQQWQNREPFLIPGLPGPPECPDYFAWNGWYYLLFSSQFVTHYRMSRNPFGPWLHPQVDTLAGPAARVLKTATFTGNRRIGAAWLGTRVEDKDHGPFQFGGNAVFREIVPEADGRLGTKFPVEMTPVTGPTLPLSFQPVTPGVTAEAAGARLAAREGLAVAQLPNMPHSLRLTARIRPEPASAEFGFRWRAAASLDSGYELSFSPYQEIVRLHDQALFAVEGLDRPFSLEVILLDDIIDVCIDNHRTIVNRCPELRGDRLLVYAQNGEVLFEEIELSPIL
jgi:hypothetical protein